MTAVQAENKLWGFVDNTGNITAEPQFKAVLTPFSEGLAGVRTIDGKAYAKTDGTIAFMADYDQLYPLRKESPKSERELSLKSISAAASLFPSASAGDIGFTPAVTITPILAGASDSLSGGRTTAMKKSFLP